MKLNADILYRELNKQYKASIHGSYENRLTLSRPEFYMDGEDSFLTDHLYLATVEHLPRRPKIQRGAVLVCIGDSLTLRYYEERLCLITIHNKADFFKAYSFIQNVFTRYDEWEKSLYKDLLSDSSIPALLKDSCALFQKPLMVLDASFHIIASGGAALNEKGWVPSQNGALNPDSLTKFMGSSDLMTEKHGALQIEIDGNRTLCVNLFDRESRYLGCLCVGIGEEDFDEGTSRLAEFLAEQLETAMERDPAITADETPSLRSVLRTLIDEQPISQAQRLILNSANHKTAYKCVILQYRNRKNRIPAAYICDFFEETFPDSCAFLNEEAIVCFLKLSDTAEVSKKTAAKEEMCLKEFIASMKLRAGVSEAFSDLFDIRIHYRQALSAIDNGSLMDPGRDYCTFEDYALSELILNALGELPSEAYFPSGLSEIIRHDDTSGISYLETLKVYLEENLSFTSAARRLYIHRSTLIDRIARIEKELNISLKDPDQRLRMEIVLKAIEIEKTLKEQ